MARRTWRRAGLGVMVGVVTGGVLVPTAVAGAAEPGVIAERSVAIGGELTVSGPECLLNGAPGTMMLGLAAVDDPDQVAWGFDQAATTDENGAWTVTTTIPTMWSVNGHTVEAVHEGTYIVINRCLDPAGGPLMTDVQGDTDLVHITGTPTTTLPSSTTVPPSTTVPVTTTAPSATTAPAPTTTTTMPTTTVAPRPSVPSVPSTPKAVTAQPRYTG
jgi:hypothetical protein